MDRIDENDCRALYKCAKNAIFTSFVAVEINEINTVDKKNIIEHRDIDPKCAEIANKYQPKKRQERMVQCINFRGVLSNGEWVKIIKM